jgi:hypothetical protein
MWMGEMSVENLEAFNLWIFLNDTHKSGHRFMDH